MLPYYSPHYRIIDISLDHKAPQRPIVLVCHSLGGIIAKKVSLFCHLKDMNDAAKRPTLGAITGAFSRTCASARIRSWHYILGYHLAEVLPPQSMPSLTHVPATPHGGSSLAAYGSALATVTKYCSPFSPPKALLETLRRDSQGLLELTADFIAKASRLQIVSFYEMNMTRIGLVKRMVHIQAVPRQSRQ